MKQIIWQNIAKVKEYSPLVHNITNFVVMNNSANALLACGASPIMAHAVEELEQMVSICSATVINIGTLDDRSVESMVQAMRYARKFQKPTVIDPVGIGATSFRKESVAKILAESTPTVIRGNASEIISLSGIEIESKGVDNTASINNSIKPAIQLCDKLDCVISVSGTVDVVVSKDRIAMAYNGSPMLEKVTGVGCSLSAIHAAMLAVCDDPFIASLSAVTLMGVCGEIASENSVGSGSLQVNLLDKLYNITKDEFISRVNVEVKNR